MNIFLSILSAILKHCYYFKSNSLFKNISTTFTKYLYSEFKNNAVQKKRQMRFIRVYEKLSFSYWALIFMYGANNEIQTDYTHTHTHTHTHTYIWREVILRACKHRTHTYIQYTQKTERTKCEQRTYFKTHTNPLFRVKWWGEWGW